jgi:hypothetical protein
VAVRGPDGDGQAAPVAGQAASGRAVAARGPDGDGQAAPVAGQEVPVAGVGAGQARGRVGGGRRAEAAGGGETKGRGSDERERGEWGSRARIAWPALNPVGQWTSRHELFNSRRVVRRPTGYILSPVGFVMADGS